MNARKKLLYLIFNAWGDGGRGGGGGGGREDRRKICHDFATNEHTVTNEH